MSKPGGYDGTSLVTETRPVFGTAALFSPSAEPYEDTAMSVRTDHEGRRKVSNSLSADGNIPGTDRPAEVR